MNSTVIYFRDKAGHLIALECQWTWKGGYSKAWKFIDLATEKRLIGAPNPAGKVFVYTIGLMEAFSTQAQYSISSAIEFVKGFSPLKAKKEKRSEHSTENDDEETPEYDNGFARQVEAKLHKEAQRLREQAEANERLQEQIVEMQQQAEELKKLKAAAETKNKEEVERQRQVQLEEVEILKKELERKEEQKHRSERKLEEYQQILEQYSEKEQQLNTKLQSESETRLKKEEEAERLRKERELLELQKKESEEKVNVLTGGLGWEVFKKVNLQKQMENDSEDEQECVICMDNKVECIIEPCGHKVLCNECYGTLKKSTCPVCNSPITGSTKLET